MPEIQRDPFENTAVLDSVGNLVGMSQDDLKKMHFDTSLKTLASDCENVSCKNKSAFEWFVNGEYKGKFCSICAGAKDRILHSLVESKVSEIVRDGALDLLKTAILSVVTSFFKP